jgi:hypothetical protein
MQITLRHRESQFSRPLGVILIASVFLLASAYLLLLGALMLLRPGVVGMAAGAVLLSGLEVAGPFMFLLMATVGSAIAWGLFCLHNWARRAAIVISIAGIVMLVPGISGEVIALRIERLAWVALQFMVRVLIIFYLYQSPVRGAFQAGK